MTHFKSKKEAADFIISMRTLPSQIDYVSPFDRKKESIAENMIADDQEMQNYVEEKVDSYYAPCFEDTDGRTYSAADMNNMF